MKIWRSFGSGHSAHLTVIGHFKSINDAKIASELLTDFVNGSWEERYQHVGAFIEAWKSKFEYLPYLGLSDMDFQMGIDRECDVTASNTTVSVSSRSNQIGGIVKLMLLKGPIEIKVTGTPGP